MHLWRERERAVTFSVLRVSPFSRFFASRSGGTFSAATAAAAGSACHHLQRPPAHRIASPLGQVSISIDKEKNGWVSFVHVSLPPRHRSLLPLGLFSTACLDLVVSECRTACGCVCRGYRCRVVCLYALCIAVGFGLRVKFVVNR
ncbi:hypothetical protein RHMOL_Rhmol10G0233800 [Rhododendron molle]|uniref:Uncharacterized protein n=1 Tax=Rhododendron molle TaxID=49168 RepID=A0ACC0M531_RHOML|nr:hypothetical protein RHMOL_Rhmol10G0233800 [Rhododendron molle]